VAVVVVDMHHAADAAGKLATLLDQVAASGWRGASCAARVAAVVLIYGRHPTNAAAGRETLFFIAARAFRA
jgi:hypothetical protein